MIADDQALVRAGLAALLDAEPDLEVVGTASDGIEALALARELTARRRLPRHPDARDGRDRGGPASCADRASSRRSRCSILTTFDLDDYVFGALEAGASGFLLKDADPATIVRAVRQVAAGQGTLDQALTRRVLREFVHRRSLQPVTAGRAGELLTPRERDILLLLAQGMSNEDIAAALTVEVSTVKSHLARLLPKLGVRSRLQAVVWAYQSGVVAVPDR